MSDTTDSSTSGGFDAGTEVSDSSTECVETVETELYTDETQTELYDPGYDHSEYEEELMTDVYEDKDGNEIVYTRSYEPSFNRDGEPIGEVPCTTNEDFIIRDENYAENGEWHLEIDWDKYAVNSEEGTGFDKTQPCTEEVLPEGFVFSRFGSERGRFATDTGTDFPSLSLPYAEKSMEYHEYRVCKSVSCRKGVAAENFGEKGGGTQYMFDRTFSDMLADGTIERVKK